MGLDTLINGPKTNGHRRGDLALVISVLLGAIEGYRAFAGSPALAAPEISVARFERLEAAVGELKESVAVLKSKVK